MKRKIIAGIMLMVVLGLAGCTNKGATSNSAGSNDAGNNESAVAAEEEIKKVENKSSSCMVDSSVQENLKKVMDASQLSNVDTFFGWVNDYNSTVGIDLGLVEKWAAIDKINYQEGAMSQRWNEKYSGKIDSNCRITTFLLMEDLINGKSMGDYGSYIMFDADEIENNKKYEEIKDKAGEFKAVFDEVTVEPAGSEDDYRNAYINAWNERKVVFPEGNASMVSVIMNDSYSDVMFVGHVGVMLNEDDYVLFIEKIAPAMPYQVTKLKDKTELKEMLLDRQDYRPGDEKYGPFILENNKELE